MFEIGGRSQKHLQHEAPPQSRQADLEVDLQDDKADSAGADGWIFFC